MWGMEGYGWGWFGLTHMLLWWVLIILGIAVLVRWLARSPGQSIGPREETALEVLKKRYAKGEIGREEFEQKSATSRPERHGTGSVGAPTDPVTKELSTWKRRIPG